MVDVWWECNISKQKCIVHNVHNPNTQSKCHPPQMTSPHCLRTSAPSQSARQSFQLAINTRAVKNAKVSACSACRRIGKERKLMKVHPTYQLLLQAAVVWRKKVLEVIWSWYVMKARWVDLNFWFSEDPYCQIVEQCPSQVQRQEHDDETAKKYIQNCRAYFLLWVLWLTCRSVNIWQSSCQSDHTWDMESLRLLLHMR